MKRGNELLVGAIVLVLSMAFVPARQQAPNTEQRAEAALQAGDHLAAVELYRQVVAAEPENIGALFGLGQALYFAGDIDEGIALLETVREASGGAGIVLYVLGQAYLEANRFAEADRALGGAAASRPDEVPLAFLRAELCYRIGRGAVAAKRLERVIELAPQWAIPHLRLGALRLDERRYAEAVVALDRAITLRADDVDTAMLLAVAYSRVGLPEKGLDVLERVAGAVPDSIAALLGLAERYNRLGRADELIATADRILALAPGHPMAEFRRAERANLEGDLQTALQHAQRAARVFSAAPRIIPGARADDRWSVVNGFAPDSMRLVADLQYRLGQTEAARAGAEALVADFPLYPDGHFLLGNMLLRAKDETGRVHLERFKRLTDARIHADLGTNSLLVEEADQAVVEFTAARALVPEHPVASVGLAAAWRRTGDAAAAVELLEQTRRAGADATRWYANYILALGALERRQEAMTAWSEVVQLGLEMDYEVHAYIYADVDACRE